MSENVEKLYSDMQDAVNKAKELFGEASKSKMSPHAIWKKVIAENLTEEQHKQLLIDNGIIIKQNKNMSNGSENYESAPIEFLHGRLIELFHEWRKTKTENTSVEINGSEFNRIIAKAKTETYAKYPKQKLQEAILKTDM